MAAVLANRVETALAKIALQANIGTSMMRPATKIHAMQVLVEATYARMIKEP